MAVGDDELFVAHLLLNRLDQTGVGDLPDAVYDSIFIGHIDRWRGLRSEERVDLAGIFIEKKKLLIVNASGAKKIEPVGLGLGQGLLVAEDDFGGIVLDAAERNESAALKAGS